MKTFMGIVAALFLLVSAALAGGLVTGGSRYKFEPGDKILIDNDFRKCPVGEPPQGFDEVVGAPECVKFDNRIWIAPSNAGDLKLYKKVDLGNGDFAIEFSIVLHKARYCWAVLELYQTSPKGWHAVKIKRTLVFNAYGEIHLEGVGKIAEFPHCQEKPYHLAVQVRRGQFRVFLNGRRLTSVPFGLKEGERVSGFALMRVRGSYPYEVLFSGLKVTRYTRKEAKPTPEQLGISVEKTSTGLKLTVPERVLFDFNRFTLKPEAKKALEVVADLIRANPTKRVLVTGYTDNVGSDAYNLRLSLQRAQSVADYLIYCEKIDAGMFKIVGKGEADPIADNNTEAGRAKNRRVEIKLLKGQGK